MTPQALKALKGSIQKWHKVILGASENGSDDCPLCHIYNRGDNYCKECPVYKATGELWCRGTPYKKFRERAVFSGKELLGKKRVGPNGEGRREAQQMYNFLVNLLRKEATR